jgi:hypothetical protein
VSRTDPLFAMFFEVFEQFTPSQQRAFINFAWGRSRLPREDEWVDRFELTPIWEDTPGEMNGRFPVVCGVCYVVCVCVCDCVTV